MHTPTHTIIIVLTLLLGSCSDALLKENTMPNIVFIMADDMGFNDVGFHGGDVKTPNIDALAAHGIILNRHYTQPCCTPSRAALMTAKYPIRTGMQGLPMPAGTARGLPLSEKIFPQYFKDIGYKTHLIGKWHLGYESWSHTPTRRGFDSFFGYYNGYTGYYDVTHTQTLPDEAKPGRDFRRNEQQAWDEVYGHYVTDVLTEEAVKVIQDHGDYGGMLMLLNHMAPHTGNQDLFREAPQDTTNFTGRAIYADMVAHLDDSVGRVFDALSEKGILNNTIIVFISDNGAPTVDPFFNFVNYGSNWPLRGVKMSVHEGGIRTPAFIWSPSISMPGVSEKYFHITDWLPTLYSAVGGPSNAFWNIDGLNQWNSLLDSRSGPRNEFLVELDEQLGIEALVYGQWKLVKNYGLGVPNSLCDQFSGVSGRDVIYDQEDVLSSVVNRILGKPALNYLEVRNKATVNPACTGVDTTRSHDCSTKYCLFNIAQDPSECRDLSAQFPYVVSELKVRLDDYRRASVPKRNATFDPRSDPELWDDFWTPWLESGTTNFKSNFSSVLLLALALLYLQFYTIDT